MPPPVVSPLTPALLHPAATVLARAFRDNPAMQAAVPNRTPEARLAILDRCMVGFIRSVQRWGVAEVALDGANDGQSGTVVGVSLAFAPKKFPPPLLATAVQATGVIRGGPDVTFRFLRLDRETRKRHPHYDHWYLWFLGVDPERQGQGIGSVLLRSLSAKAEASGVPCYLETDKLSSVRIYERHGYVVHSEEVFPKFDLRIWFMNRPEKKPRTASMGSSEQG